LLCLLTKYHIFVRVFRLVVVVRCSKYSKEIGMKRQMLVVVLMMGIVSQVTFGQEKSWRPHGSLSLTLQEKYIGLRVSKNLHDDAMIWTNLKVDNLPLGTYVAYWQSVGLDDSEFSSNGGDEIDVTVGICQKLAGINIDLSATLFNSPKFGDWWEDVWVQTLVFSKGFTFGDHSFKPAMIVEWISSTDDFDGGAVVLRPNISHTWQNPFGLERVSFSHCPMICWDDGFDLPGDDSNAVFLRWSAGVNWQISENISATLPGVTCLWSIVEGDDGRGEETSLNASLKWSF